MSVAGEQMLELLRLIKGGTTGDAASSRKGRLIKDVERKLSKWYNAAKDGMEGRKLESGKHLKGVDNEMSKLRSGYDEPLGLY